MKIIRETLEGFCQKFITHPYLCYTEHGQHALFYHMLLKAIPEELHNSERDGQQVCILQKEYRTAENLNCTKRQHWDIAVLSPSLSTERVPWYDFLEVLAAIEFGMNEKETHLREDIRRLCHSDANVKNRFIVHLYRISGSGDDKFSGRDRPKTSNLPTLTAEAICAQLNNQNVEIYFILCKTKKPLQFLCSGFYKFHLNCEIAAILL